MDPRTETADAEITAQGPGLIKADPAERMDISSSYVWIANSGRGPVSLGTPITPGSETTGPPGLVSDPDPIRSGPNQSGGDHLVKTDRV